MKFKTGVVVNGVVIVQGKERHAALCQVILDAAKEFDRESQRKYGIEAVITSGIEGTHKENSKHYQGEAVDLRSREYTEEQAVYLMTWIKNRFPSCDVVDERETASHIHIEYDPK